MKAKNLRVYKFVIVLQVSNPDALKTTSARLSEDKKAIIITMADPDQFDHNHRKDIVTRLAEAITPDDEEPEIQVQENFVSHMSTVYSKATGCLCVEDIDIDLAMKKMYCVLPPDIWGSNEFFNDGDPESAFCLHFSRPQHAHLLYFRNKPHFE